MFSLAARDRLRRSSTSVNTVLFEHHAPRLQGVPCNGDPVLGSLRLDPQHPRLLADVTNQSEIGLQVIDEQASITARLVDLLAHIEAVELWLHSPDDLRECGRLRPTMMRRAAHRRSSPMAAIVVVGRRVGDVEMAVARGPQALLSLSAAAERVESDVVAAWRCIYRPRLPFCAVADALRRSQ